MVPTVVKVGVATTLPPVIESYHVILAPEGGVAVAVNV